MSPLETVLVVLVVIWTIIFLIIAVGILIIVLSIKRALGKANKILEKTEALADQVNIPSKVVIGAILGFIAKNSVSSIKLLLKELFAKKTKNNQK